MYLIIFSFFYEYLLMYLNIYELYILIMDIVNYPNFIIYDILKNYINSQKIKNIYLQSIFNLELQYFYKEQIFIENSEENLKQENLEEENLDDPWESSINDNKFYINNKVARIFPILKNFNNFSKIKIDDESFSYITIREIADLISKIICFHLLEYNLNPQKTKITDYTSGVGGNVLSFSKYFKYVYAVEICEKRAEYLENNINIYGCKNIKVINTCALEFNENKLIQTNPNIIFMDPPWGGTNYKNIDNLLLNLGSISIENLIIDITKKFSNYYDEIIKINPKEKINNCNNKFIIIKLPKNYNVEYLYNFIKSNNNFVNYNILIYLYILNKMLIVVCELQFIHFENTI